MSMRENREFRLALALTELQKRQAEAKYLYRLQQHPNGKGASREQISFWQSDCFGRVILGANRSGKSEAGAIEILEWCTVSQPPRGVARKTRWGREIPRTPIYARIVTPELPSTMDKPHVARDKIKNLCPSHWLRGGNWSRAYSVMGHTVHFENGSLIEFLSSEQATDKHAGQSVNCVWFDEELPKQIFDENMARLDQDHGAWWLTYTPVMGLRWIYDQIYLEWLKGAKDLFLVEIDIEKNRGNLGRNFIEKLEAGLSEDQRSLRLRGRYTINAGLVYDVFGQGNIVEVEVEDDGH